MSRRLLVVIPAEVAEGVIRDFVRSRGGDDAEMLVVSRASGISQLDLLTNARVMVSCSLDELRGEGVPLAEPIVDALPFS